MSFDPGAVAEVSYRHEDDRWTLVFVRSLAAYAAQLEAARRPA